MALVAGRLNYCLNKMKAFLSHVTALGMYLLGGIFPSLGQVPNQLKQSIPAPPVGMQSTGQLGSSVGIDGNYIVVGAPRDDFLGEDSGVVKVFDVGNGKLLFVLGNPNEDGYGDHFGDSVAISGTKVVVGAPGASFGATRAGSAYVYDFSDGNPTVPIATLHNPNPAVNSNFGTSVAISGTRVVVGAWNDGAGAPDAGSAHVYNLTGATPSVPIATLHNPNPGTLDRFGTAVAISGTLVAVGAVNDLIGTNFTWRVYVYDISSGTPTEPIATLDNPNPGQNGSFGNAVAISGTRLVVGDPTEDTGAYNAGSAYVYDLTDATPTTPIAILRNPDARTGDNFGQSVAISGTHVIVGARHGSTGADAAGSAYVYDVSNVAPTVPVATLRNPEPGNADYFGFSVGIVDTRLVVGTPYDDMGAVDAGSAYVYDLNNGTPTMPLYTLNNPGVAPRDHFGHAVALSGTRLVVGSPFENTEARDAGSAYVYDLNGGANPITIATLNNPDPGIADQFGNAVAISGARVVVGAGYDDAGATDAGSVYIYDLNGGTPTVPVITLHNPVPSGGAKFGTSVAIFGTRVVVGTTTSIVHVYDLNSGTPTVPVATLNTPGFPGDYFGWSVAIFGTQIVVGTPSDNTAATRAGRAYVYDLNSPSPSVPLVTINNPRPAANDHFGDTVAISGTWLVVGADWDDEGAVDAGSAYAFNLGSGSPNMPAVIFNNPAPAKSDFFGCSVAISGTRVVVGAFLDHTVKSQTGRAFIYDLSSTDPEIPVSTLNHPHPTGADVFGNSVAIDCTTVAIGARYDDTTMLDKGAVYVFGPSPYSIWKAAQAGDQFASDLGNIDGDGLVNLVEYGLVHSPSTPDATANEAEIFAYPEGQRLRLFLQRDPARNDVTIEVQAAGALAGPWTTVAASVLGSPFSGAGYVGGDGDGPGLKTVEVRDVVNLADASERFLRIRVTH